MKVTIIGAGRVGATTAFLLLEKKLVEELLLIDVAVERAKGEALDLMHSTSSFGKKVKITGSGDYKDAAGSGIIVITAGIPRKMVDTRLDLLKKNTDIMKEIARGVKDHVKDAVILVVSNPVDVMTYVIQKTSGFEHQRVLGLGTMLDSIRLKSIIAEKMNIKPSDVYAIMLGEHGDSMFMARTQTFIKGKSIYDTDLLPKEELGKIEEEVKTSAMEVIKLKGPTYYAPATAIAEVLDSIIGDKNNILPVSIYSKEHGIYISSLARVGWFGVRPAITQLNNEEKKLFNQSAEILKKACAETGV